MRDRVGNTVRPGDLLLWQANHLIVEVVEALDDDSPKVEIPGQERGQRHGKLAFKISLPVPRDPRMDPSVELMLSDFVRVVNPKSEDVIDRIAGRGGPVGMPPRKQ